MSEILWFMAAQSLALLLVLALRPLLRRCAGAVAQYQAWLVVPAVLLARWLPAPQLPELQRVQALPLQWVAAPVLANLGPRSANPSEWWVALWLGGALAVLVWAAVSHVRFLSTLQRRGRHWQLAAGASPACVGLLPARVALPLDFRQRFTRPERRLVLAHERVHARRGDNAWSLLALLLTALLWFNPLAWWSLRRFHGDQELACDAAVLRCQPGSLRLYTQALLKAQKAQPFSAFARAYLSHPLVERIAMLPTHPLHRPRPGLTALILAAACGLAYAAQPAVSPASAPALESGYSKLRVDLQFAVNGQLMGPSVLVLDMGHPLRVPINAQPGNSYVIEVKGMPVAEGMMELTVQLQDDQTGKSIGPLRLLVPEGQPAGMAHAAEGTQPLLQLALLPRLIRTRLFDTTGAQIELLRDMASGQAPGAYYPR
jgi:beta-lactamase regulating signal transducer with metallopeptidase domain